MQIIPESLKPGGPFHLRFLPCRGIHRNRRFKSSSSNLPADFKLQLEEAISLRHFQQRERIQEHNAKIFFFTSAFSVDDSPLPKHHEFGHGFVHKKGMNEILGVSEVWPLDLHPLQPLRFYVGGWQHEDTPIAAVLVKQTRNPGTFCADFIAVSGRKIGKRREHGISKLASGK